MALEDDGKPKIVVAGVGGAGCNTINRLMRMGVGDMLPIAFNTDKKHLEIVHEKARKVLLGASVTRGLGAGGFPEVAQRDRRRSARHADNAGKFRRTDGADLRR